MEQKKQKEQVEQCELGEKRQQQQQRHGPIDSTVSYPVPAPLYDCLRHAECEGPPASSSDCATGAGADNFPNGTLLFWAASGEAAGTAVPELPSCLQVAPGEPYEEGESCRSAAPTCRIFVRTGSSWSFHTVLQQHLLQRQQRHIGTSSSSLMRHVLLAQEEKAAFFSPERLPLLLYLCSRSISPAQQRQRPVQNFARCEFPSIGAPGQGGKIARVGPTAVAKRREDCLLLSFIWAVASWFPRLTDPLPVPAAAAAAELGLCSTTSARALSLAFNDPFAAAAAAALAGGDIPLQQPVRAATLSTIVTAAFPRGGTCLRLAALRALAYWCCCCTLTEQEATHDVQRNRMRQHQRQQLTLHAAPPRINSSEIKRESSRTSSSMALLRQLQQECRESFAQLLSQQRDAQQQLAERQGIEMEAACALREKQEQALKVAIAARCLPAQDAKEPTAVAVAVAALEACERDLQELVQQHLSECELLERHWVHEQQLLRKQQLHMFKNVTADLYLLQHGSAAADGAACQELVLPPLPSADETERWAFNRKQQQQEQQRQEQLLQDQQQRPTWRQMGIAARQLFRRRGGSPNQEGDSYYDARSCADGTSAAASATTAEKEEHTRSSGAGAPHSGSTAVAAAAIGALMNAAAAAGQDNQQQQQQSQQAAFTSCKVDNSARNGPAYLQRGIQQKQQQQQQKQHVLQGSYTDFAASTAHSQYHKQHQRQLAVAAAAHQGPVFDMPRLLRGIAAGVVQQQQCRTSGVPQQHQQPRMLGGVQKHAEVRLLFGAQQRRTLWLHVCTGHTADFFPSTASPEPQNQQQQGTGAISCAGKWLSMLGHGAFEEPLADWPGGSISYCYKDVRHMRGSTPSCLVGSSGRLCGEPLSWPEADDPADDMFAALKSGPGASLSGAVLPTGAALQESFACIKAGNCPPDLLLPSLEEQRSLLRVALHAAKRSSNCPGSKQRLLLQQGEVFISRHAATLRPNICFHLAVASARQSHEASQTPSPAEAAKSAEASMERDSSKRRSSAGDDIDSLCAPVCAGLRQILRLCEKHAVGALLLPALLLETEASASCLPFALLQRRMLAVLRCVVTELRAIALSPVSSSCCSSDASVGRLKHLVLLLPPIQQQQQEGSGQMNLLVQAAVNFLRNTACCC
ncbi:hypothetical protein, conserved [Eimeria brunetti]|uniref:Uncharacterized protein n=1 Tax=Eimeria brunetti TaxID=51314 RepID=U6LEG0_9EIME|nr:hypothetical protein, conserved [Eimeria brunetti]